MELKQRHLEQASQQGLLTPEQVSPYGTICNLYRQTAPLFEPHTFYSIWVV